MRFGARFLVEPENFPDGARKKAWGGRSIAVDVAGPVRFVGLDDRQVTQIEARYGRSPLHEAAGADVDLPQIDCAYMAPEAFRIFDRGRAEYTVDLHSSAAVVRIAGYHFVGVLSFSPTLAGTVWTCETDTDEFSAVIENFYRIFTAYQALEQGGILLHSAAVLHEGRAYVFCGRSGIGKSTLAGNALKAGYRILSDDLNLVLAGRTPMVRRVPFAGTYGRAPARGETYPLGGLIRLKQGHNQSHSLSPAAAFVAIMAAAPFVNRDRCRYQRLAEVAEALCRTFKPWELAASREAFDPGLLEAPPTEA